MWDTRQVGTCHPAVAGIEPEQLLGRVADELGVAPQVSAHVHIGAESGVVLRFERLDDPRVEAQPLRRLRHGEPAVLAPGAQPRTRAAALLAAHRGRHGRQPGLRSSSARARAWSDPGKSSCRRRA